MDKVIYQQNVAGMKYGDHTKAVNLQAGSSLTLIPEPNNPYDPNAILVYHNSTKIGYVPREDTWKLLPYLHNQTPLLVTCLEYKTKPRPLCFFGVACAAGDVIDDIHPVNQPNPVSDL